MPGWLYGPDDVGYGGEDSLRSIDAAEVSLLYTLWRAEGGGFFERVEVSDKVSKYQKSKHLQTVFQAVLFRTLDTSFYFL